ncbi:hypothetical protein [Owenweeksia hongkongensis]|uniref:Lipoprotein n=1 Tax=Owenweeksia hongkongensis (strain DSM 17368 / CIP 108786 / JCM 12287 / NRRL B-23963 / UST20020801) TaxID=926562 RepID=G8R710_OWEHD|nr:hypothetical protein [Owenweeksia hongkongensis]AEV33375.1 hypothetical protein Oweho_2405 [Owenweeksia hongkongensis DSM 17368]
MRIITIFIFTLLVATGCGPSSNLMSSWSGESEEAKKYHKLYVMAMFPNMETRVAVENAMVDALVAKGVRAMVSYDEFPMAGKAKELMGMARDSAMLESVKQSFKEKVIRKEADGIFMISAFDIQKTKEYHQGGPSITIAAPVYGNSYPYPGYGGSSSPYAYGSYYDYYAYNVATAHSEGYYTTSSTYYLQNNLFDVASEQLIYSSQSKTIDYKDLNDESAKLSGLIVEDITAKNVLVTKNVKTKKTED